MSGIEVLSRTQRIIVVIPSSMSVPIGELRFQTINAKPNEAVTITTNHQSIDVNPTQL